MHTQQKQQRMKQEEEEKKLKNTHKWVCTQIKINYTVILKIYIHCTNTQTAAEKCVWRTEK